MQSSTPGTISLNSIFERDVDKSIVKPLPHLRADIQLLAAANTSAGLPCWTLYDPLRGKFFRIGWVEFELLKRWNTESRSTILEKLSYESTIRATTTHVEELEKMLIENELVEVPEIADIARLLKKKHARSISLIKRLFTFALFYKKPLVNPDAFLQKTDLLLQPVYRQKSLFYSLIVFFLLFVGFGFSAHAYELKDTFAQFMNPGGFLLFVLVLSFTNVLHEIGHGLVARHFGCSVRQMGVALIFMLPVCYCDTTDAWRLKDHRQRLWINAGGIAAEVLLALIAGFLWLVFPDGIFKTFAFFIAVTSLGTTFLINLNPFLKFDGYYLLADYLQIDNFQTKSFSTMRWQLRSLILGRGDPMPYRVSRSQKNIMCFYASLTWLYRFFLYQIIALMVYQFWFKALGIAMMVGVVCTMLIQPVLKELLFYMKTIRNHGVNGRTLLSGSLFIALILLFLVPLPRMVSAPAVLSVSEVIRVFAPVSSQVKRINVQMGDEVSQGQTLFVLEDSELLFQRDSLMQEIQLLKYKMSRQTSWSATAEENQISENHLKAKQAALADVEQSISMLTVNAEGPGQIVSLPAWLTAGVWVTQNDVLLELAQIRSPEIRAYVSAQHVDRIHGDRATFYTSPSNNEYPLQIASISPQSISVLTDESLAITHGGSIAVEQGSSGELIPVQDWHQLKFGATDVATINREKQGYVMFSATPRSIAASAVSRTYGMLIRESGF